MSGYILSILGIIVAGVVIDVIIPSGSINKYIKSIYAIFVVAVILMPILNFFVSGKELSFKYENYEIQQSLADYIFQKRAETTKLNILKDLEKNGLTKIDIELNYSTNNNELLFNSCIVNLKNMVISTDKQHINKYDYIIEIVSFYTNLTEEEIIINEWKRKKTK